MNAWKRIIGFAICMTCVQVASVGAVEIELAAIPLLFQEDRQGVYDQVIAEAVKRAKVQARYDLLPPKRARMEFETTQKGCYSPSNKAEYAENDAVIASTPFNMVKALVLTRKDKPVIHRADDLRQKTVGLVRGLRFDAMEGIPGLKLEMTTTNEQSLKKLLAGRIDAMVDYAPDILLALEKNADASGQVQYDPNYFLFAAENSVICFRTAETEAFLQAFDLAIETMKRDGMLRKILGDAYLFEQ